MIFNSDLCELKSDLLSVIKVVLIIKVVLQGIS